MSEYQDIVAEISQDEPNFIASLGGNIDSKNSQRVIGKCVASGRDGIHAILNAHGLLMSIECPRISDGSICGVSKGAAGVCANVVKTIRPEQLKSI